MRYDRKRQDAAIAALMTVFMFDPLLAESVKPPRSKFAGRLKKRKRRAVMLARRANR